MVITAVDKSCLRYAKKTSDLCGQEIINMLPNKAILKVFPRWNELT